ncbi:MAG: tetratricopeptide repeat protein, partial [Sediminibacterium sp.]
ILSGLLLFSVLYFFTPRFAAKADITPSQTAENQVVTTESILNTAKLALSENQKIALLSIENQLIKASNAQDSLRSYKALTRFWADSAQKLAPYLYFTYSAALLENSEKSLTFAAQLLVDNLLTPDAPPALLPWIAGNAKVLLEKALVINPKNDSAKINLGACYLFGNLSDNPMQGITKIKEVVDKDSTNAYGQFILALGGKKSGQYDKAIERFLTVINIQPNQIEAMIHLAECYELTDQKALAIEWYTKVRNSVNIPEAKEAISKRIKELKK